MGLAADFVLIVVAGLVGGLLARAARLPLLVGYVAAGVVVGPHTAGPTVVQVHDIETLAEIGVALLLFSLGLEISFRDLQSVRRIALLGGPVQILLTIALAAAGSLRWLGFSPGEAIWFGAMVSVSSTMVVLKIVAAGGVTSTLASRVMIGLLLVQDLAVIPMLVILPQLGAGDSLALRVAGALLLAAALLATVYFAGTWLLPPVFRRILTWGSSELFLVAVLAAAVGIGAAMHAAGFSFALGAFVAGLVLSESEFSHQALSDMAPLRDVFGLLFFVTVGMLFDPAYALRNAALIAAVVIAILIGKALVFGLLARAFGYRFMAPWIVGAGLCQIGEFSFVLARTGYQDQLIGKPVYDLVLTATVLTMAISPAVSAAALPLGRAWKRRFGSPHPAPPPVDAPATADGQIIVAGYGRTGRAVVRALREAGLPCLVVESSYPLATDARGEDVPALWGDISREEILHAAGVSRARMLLLTMPDPPTVELTIERVRRLRPGLSVVARTTDLAFLDKLQQQGVASVQPEFEGGLEMVRRGLRDCGMADGEAQSLLARVRREMYHSSGRDS